MIYFVYLLNKVVFLANNNQSDVVQSPTIKAETKMRLKSLDIFRGITIPSMIIVNNPRSWNHVYPPLIHAKRHGCIPTDLIFSFFLFIMGVAMTFSLSKYTYNN